MNTEIFNNPKALLDKGFKFKEEDTSDNPRQVVYKKKFLIGDSGFYFLVVVTYSLTIYDNPYVSYTDNLYYFFENVSVLFKNKYNKIVATLKPNIASLEDFDVLTRFCR